MNRCVGTSFADTQDLRAYNRALLQGRTPKEGLEVGDNGLGAWNLSTVSGTGPCVALSSNTEGFRRNRLLRVFYGTKYVDATVRDIAPDGVLDMNPDCCRELGLVPPVKVMVDWIWL
jgi:hypothetical protein